MSADDEKLWPRTFGAGGDKTYLELIKELSDQAVALREEQVTPLRERLAAYAHAAWSGWMEYLLSNCGGNQADGSVHIPAGYVEALRRQMTTAYADLSENDKDSDRHEADRMITIMEEATRMSEQQAPYETSEPKAIPGLIEGRNVHYVLPEEYNTAGEHRAAIICRVLNSVTGLCNLNVFFDGNNDKPALGAWVGTISYSPDAEPGTWHFMERA